MGTCGDSLRRRFPFALAGEVSGSGGARTPRRRMQLGAAAAACRRAHGAPAAAAPTPCAGAPREQRLAPGTAGACGGRGALSGWTAAGASHPITSGARDRCGSACGRVRCWQCRCDRRAPVLRAPVRACVDERAGGRVEAMAALEIGWWTINIPCYRLRDRGDFWRLSSKACPELQPAGKALCAKAQGGRSRSSPT